MSNYDDIEELTASFVREYLSRKEFADTFDSFEKEFPRTEKSISSRLSLVKCVHLERQIKKNKECSKPFRTILEVIVNYLQERKNQDSHKNEQQQSSVPKKTFVDPTIINNEMITNKKGHSRYVKSGVETHDAAPTRVNKQRIYKQIGKEIKSGSLDLEDDESICSIADYKEAEVKQSFSEGISAKPVVNARSTVSELVGDLEIEDCEDIETEIVPMNRSIGQSKAFLQAKCRAITLSEAVDLRRLLFGRESTTFSNEWMKQGFKFNDVHPKLYYGLVQDRGGPCGVLAAVQAYVIFYLFFSSEMKKSASTNTKPERSRQSLALSIAHILWKAGEKIKCYVTLPSMRPKFVLGGKFRSDYLLECLDVYEFTTYTNLIEFLEAHLTRFQGNESGCILLLYSVILSRGINRLKKDMDDESNQLMGAHGYCTQEMVNLLLTGKSTSNVFDNIIELDGGGKDKCILKGVSEKSEVGFLSLFEHYDSCKVGSFMKSPIYPLWVVCSESHFSVLFGQDPKISRESPKKFDLYYYDGLARQDDEIKLSIDLLTSPLYNDLIPPLDHCIRTKWKNASINWNGYEPIL